MCNTGQKQYTLQLQGNHFKNQEIIKHCQSHQNDALRQTRRRKNRGISTLKQCCHLIIILFCRLLIDGYTLFYSVILINVSTE